MKKLLLAALALTGCWDFDVARSNCEATGACRFDAPDGGGEDAAVEPEPDRPGDVCETDAGIHCWEMPVIGTDPFDSAAWDGQRLWASSSGGMLASWDGRRWAGSRVADTSVAVAATRTGVSFAVAGDFVAVDGGPRGRAPYGIPLAAWADEHGRFIASCVDNLKLRLFSDAWNGDWKEGFANFDPETPCTLESSLLVGASRANLWLITSNEIYRYLGGMGWTATDAGFVSPLGIGWRDGCERDGTVFVVSPIASGKLQTNTQVFFGDTGADALGCTAAGLTLAWGGGFEQRTELEVPGLRSAIAVPFAARRMISPDGGALFAIGAGFATREANETEFSTRVAPWPDTTVVSMASSPDGGVYAVGQKGFVARRTPRGWQTISWNPEWSLTDITFDLDGVGYVAGTPLSFELRDDRLAPSSKSHLTQDGGVVAGPVSQMATLDDGTVVAVGANGYIARLPRGAPAWEVIAGPGTGRSFTELEARGDVALALNGSALAISNSGPPIVIIGDAGMATSVAVRNRNDFFISEGRVVHHFVDGGVFDSTASADIWTLAVDDASLWVIAGGVVSSRRNDTWTTWGEGWRQLQPGTLLPTPNGVFVGGRGITRIRR